LSGDVCDTALAVAERMDTGSGGLNVICSHHNAPFGRPHGSGLGVEHGMEGLARYVTYTSIHRQAG
jgi:aldehyde dehydrogenase (NAD+)